MTQFRLQAMKVAATMVLFVAMLAINEWLFTRFEFARGINWIYLPAGIRLLSTLLFAEAGAIGLLLVSWLVCFFYFFPDDPVRSFAGGILAALGPTWFTALRSTAMACTRRWPRSHPSGGWS